MSIMASKGLSNRQLFKQIVPRKSILEQLQQLGFTGLDRKDKPKSQRLSHQTVPSKSPTAWRGSLERAGIANDPNKIPVASDNMPEFAFIGRSNVGKSSLINALHQSRIIGVSDTPGYTKYLQFYRWLTAERSPAGTMPANADPKKGPKEVFTHARAIFVDMPGYGFACAPDSIKQTWPELIMSYLRSRHQNIASPCLKRVFLLIDARHGLKSNDRSFIQQLETERIPFQIVLTKSDLLSPPELAKRTEVVTRALADYRYARNPVLVASISSAKSIDALRREILRMLPPLQRPQATIRNSSRQLV